MFLRVKIKNFKAMFIKNQALDEKTRGYTCVSAIQTAFSILQSGIIDRENKSELKKLREAMERIEGEPSGIIDI